MYDADAKHKKFVPFLEVEGKNILRYPCSVPLRNPSPYP
jgi:hypothetical protein